MPSSWKWKAGLLGGIILASLYLIAPTFFDDDVPPAYADLFPEKGINLGLDLRGGIYIEFDVEVEEAIENKIDVIVSDLSRELERKERVGVTLKQNVQNHTITATAADTGALKPLVELVQRDYNDVIVLASKEGATATFELDESYEKFLRDLVTKQALEKVRNRIDRYGVAEPSIQRLGSNRIAVELPGVKDPDRAIGLIKKAGKLEFKLVDESLSQRALTQLIAEARKEHADLPESYTTAEAESLTQLLKEKIPEETEIAFEQQFDPVAKKITGGVPYLVTRAAAVTGEMLKNAQTQIQNNEPYVSLTFDAQGTTLFGEVTKKNVGKQLAITLDGVINSTPVIREAILGGQAQITLGYGSYNELLRQSEDLVLVLQEGALPAKLTEATKTVVGPSLGADSIRQGIYATIVGSLLVFLFMLIFYKGSGLVANTALAINLLLILSVLTLFQATLTLPGIAGIVLTLGIAVDSNILILERIKEELRLGKKIRAAIEGGYANAMRTIIDANVTGLIAGVVLYQFGTGPIKGFAVTLIIGLLISMYTACICTRMVYDYFLVKRKIERISI